MEHTDIPSAGKTCQIAVPGVPTGSHKQNLVVMTFVRSLTTAHFEISLGFAILGRGPERHRTGFPALSTIWENRTVFVGLGSIKKWSADFRRRTTPSEHISIKISGHGAIGKVFQNSFLARSSSIE